MRSIFRSILNWLTATEYKSLEEERAENERYAMIYAMIMVWTFVGLGMAFAVSGAINLQ